ncbi:MAG: PP2C family protein-serine/threonine phosphatase [Planctomycetota bacterium]
MKARSSRTLDTLDTALRRSATVRAWGTAGIVGVMLVLYLIQAGLAAAGLLSTSAPYFLQATPLILGMALLLFEIGLLRWLRSDRWRSAMRPAAVAINTIVECSVPTIAMVMAWYGGVIPGYAAPVLPPVVAYTFFIVLTILQLRPWLTALAGGVCAVQHAALIIAAYLALTDEAERVFPLMLYLTFPVLIAMIGVAGWFVTARVRSYVERATLERDRRHRAEADIDAARLIQRGLLPKRDASIAGWSIAGWSRPADQTGGDYWDWSALPEGKVAVSIADVAGHGIGPAIVTAFCQAYARSALHHSQRLDTALCEMARRLVRDMPTGHFVTFAVALLSPNDGRVPFLSAGHAPSLLVRAGSGDAVALDADAPPMGVFPEISFDDVPVLDLAPGDSLVLLTDGFYEWENRSDELWDIDRLVASARRHRLLDPSRMIAAILADVEAFVAGAPQLDDLTAVVIRRVAA